MSRSSLVRLAAFVLLVATAACKKNPAADVAMLDSSLVASLERGPCRGTCPVYRVELYGDGKVHFDGKQYVGTIGARNRNATAAAIQDFMRSVAASEFASADTAFMMGTASCGSYATDLPVSVLSIRVGSHLKTIQHDPGCRNAPKFLRVLAAQLDTAAGIAAWISSPGEKK